jgi:CubicO group peptidase (beta-lactamase class C family)
MREIAGALFAVALVTSATARAQSDPAPSLRPPVPFPTQEWAELAPEDPLRVKLNGIVAHAFEGERPEALAKTRGLLIVSQGYIAAERYGDGITQNTPLQSWSMAKSFLHAALGMAVLDGKIDPDGPAKVEEWQTQGDPRSAITVRQLMSMTDGLAFRENYGDTDSEVMTMLFGAGRGNVGASAASSALGHPPGTHWSYSGGSANILSRMLRNELGGRDAYARFLKERLFLPLGMRSAVAEFDASGTWIASSYVHATARDFARFGLFYLHQGVWDGRHLLPAHWTKRGCEPTAPSRGLYGELFWLNGADPETGERAISDTLPPDLCFARGFGGQLIGIIPSHDAVIVMLNAVYSDDASAIIALMAEILTAIETDAR